MKSLFRGFAAFLLMVSMAFAASAKTVDLSEYASGEGWKQFSSALVADKLMEPGADSFETIGFSNAMYNGLSEAQKASMGRVAFDRLNKMVNNLGESIKVADWPRIAGNLKLPDIQVVAKATAAPATSAPPVVVTPDKLEQQLAAFKKLTAGRFNDLDKQVDGLQKAFNNAALKSEIAGLVAEAQKVSNQLSTLTSLVNQLGGEVEGLKSAINDSTTGLAAVGSKADKAMNLATTASKDAGEAKVLAGQASDAISAVTQHFNLLWLVVAGIGVFSVLAMLIGVTALRRSGPAAAKTATAFATRHRSVNESEFVEPTLKVA